MKTRPEYLDYLIAWVAISCILSVSGITIVALLTADCGYQKPKKVEEKSSQQAGTKWAGQGGVFGVSCPGRDKAGQKAVTHLETRMNTWFDWLALTGTERDRPICPAVPPPIGGDSDGTTWRDT